MIKTISVVVLTKNSKRHLIECIESILKQDYKFDVIVIDASSNDGTTDILYEYKNGTEIPFTIENVPEFVTIGKARSIGLEKATGNIIAWIDSDVELPDEKWLGNMVKEFDDMGVGGVVTLAKCRDSDPAILKKIHGRFEYSNRIIDINNYFVVGTGSTLIRKDLINKVGGFRDVWSMEDVAVTRSIMELGYKFVYRSDQKVYHYYVDSYWGYLRKRERAFRKYIWEKTFERFFR
ncbi:MAG: glycosyltransferase family 2 protein [Pedobacter sp.]|uniref:glycosyltransferase n=1 Tax=Pedobacter sp. TaxID=1411316 RepID=UPI003565715C